ncbi:MAG: hypothetical protein GY861_18100 [bacterium]|nr:hypothetical protein [bacterium]
MSYWRLLRGRYGSSAGEDADVRIDSSTDSIQCIDYPHHEVHSGSAFYTEGHTELDDTNTFYASFTTPDSAKYGHFRWTITSNGITEVSMYEGSSGGMAGGAVGVIHAHNRNVNSWTGVHDGGDNDAALGDSNDPWVADELIGMRVYNQTDGSSAEITGNTINTVTAALAGGTGNDWDDDDVYEITNTKVTVGVGHAAPAVYGALITDTAFGGSGFKADVGGGTSRNQEIVAKRNTTYVMYILSGSDDNVITFNLDWYDHTDKH